MANDCSNRLHIYCDNEQILEKIHDLFYQVKDGEIQYTMMKLVPIPADKYDDEGNALVGFFTPMGYWGTRSDFWSPKPRIGKKGFILDYNTANGPNHYWIEDLISSIMEMIDKFPGGVRPKLFVKHIYDVLQLNLVGYMYWEPGMAMEYVYSTEEEPNEMVDSEFKSILYEHEREKEAFEFNFEDYLGEEPWKEEVILPRELINELKKEFHPIIVEPGNPGNRYYQSSLACLEFLESNLTPNELLALFRHSYALYHAKDWENLMPKVVTALGSADLKSYDIKSLEEFVIKINSIPEYLHFGVIDVICNSESVARCHDFYISGVLEQDQYNIEVEDLIHVPYNPKLEKFTKQLEKFANQNPE